MSLHTAWKVSRYGVFSGPYFPVFGLNTERYSVSLRIQSECGKIGPEKTSYLDTFHAVPVFDINASNTSGIIFRIVILRYLLLFYDYFTIPV